MQPPTISRSITKSVDLRVTPERAFEFLNHLENWPRWAIINMKSVKRAANGWHDTETWQGKGQLKMMSNNELGLLDHLRKDPQASWTVRARVIPNDDGSAFLITLFQPPVLHDDAAAKEVDKELATLKESLEQQRQIKARLPDCQQPGSMDLEKPVLPVQQTSPGAADSAARQRIVENPLRFHAISIFVVPPWIGLATTLSQTSPNGAASPERPRLLHIVGGGIEVI